MATARNRSRARKADGTFTKTSPRSVSESPTRAKKFAPEDRAPDSPRSERNVRLFSEVVASRPTSPLQDKEMRAEDRLATGLIKVVENVPSSTKNKSLFTDSDPEDPKNQEGAWTTVQPRRKNSAQRSLSDKDRSQLVSRLFEKPEKLTKEQTATVNRAAETLNEEDRERISR